MQVEVASYLFLVGLFGLKAPPAYILAVCNHRIFQSGIAAPDEVGARLTRRFEKSVRGLEQ